MSPRRRRSPRKVLIGAVVAAVVLAVVGGLALWPGSPARFLASSVAQYRMCEIHPGAGGVVGFGDSITAGHNQAWMNMGASDSYIDVLGCTSAVSYSGNAGVWMQTTDEILARVPEVVEMHPKTVALIAGTNDIIEGRSNTTIDNLDAIRNQLENAGIAVVVGFLPPSNKYPNAVIEMNERIAEWADEHQVPTFDAHTPLAAQDGTYRDGMSNDGLHPSPAGTRLIAEAATPLLTQQ